MKHSVPIWILASIAFNVAFAQHPRVSSELDFKDPNSILHIIVQFKKYPTAELHKRVASHRGVFRSELGLIRGGAYDIPAKNLYELASDQEVQFISEDHQIRSLLDNTSAAVNAGAAWQAGLTGAGIGVAVIDSGISSVDDLTNGGSRIVYKENFIHALVAEDYYGHGEHVSGIIAGNGADSTCAQCNRTFRGMAPGANLIDLRVLDQRGYGADSFVIAAIERAIQLQPVYNIRVINLSIGHPVFESYTVDPLCQAVEAAWKAGIVVVVAAGNDGRDNTFNNNGYGTITAPGNDPYVITVGAMKSMGTPQRNDDLIASYSSKGPTPIDHIVKPDLVAPGNLVVSLMAPAGSLQQSYPGNDVPFNYYKNTSSDAVSRKYFILSGTSMAAPVVSGAAALLLQANPDLTPDQIKARFMRSAYKAFPQSSVAYDPTIGQSFTSYYDMFTVGAGYLDIAAALADTNVFGGVALSPTATTSPAGTILVCSSSTICGSDSSIWGNQSVWGNQSIWGNQSVWGNGTILGQQSVWGNQSIWGNQSVWGNTTMQTSELIGIAIFGEQ